jgi:ABC-2 type transport system permease protein
VNRGKLLLIIRREYLESVRKKSFLFGLVATPAIFALAIVLPLIGGGMLAEDVVRLAVYDETGTFGGPLRERVEQDDEPPAGLPRAEITVHTPGTGPSPLTLDAMTEAGDLSGWLRIPEDFQRSGTFEFHARTVLNLAVMQDLEHRLGRLLTERRAEAAGLPMADVETLLRPVELKVFRIGEGDRETDPEKLYLQAVLAVMMLFFALLPTGQILMRSVIEEKSNRVVEVLLSSVTPRELMVGKILGLGAVGLTMLAVWGAAALLLTLQTGRALPIPGSLAGVFLLYFLPGYFFYAALLGGVGSVCSSEREAQPFLTPISLMLMLPAMLGLTLGQNPDHVVARVMSFVPFFTPSLMLFRSVVQPPPAWEIAATWVTLVAFTVAMFWASSKVFRVGILLTGKRPTVPEIARWIWAR